MADFFSITKIRNYLNSLKRANYSFSTQKRKLSSVSIFLDWAFKQGKIEKETSKQIKDEIANYRTKLIREQTALNIIEIRDKKPEIKKTNLFSYLRSRISSRLSGGPKASIGNFHKQYLPILNWPNLLTAFLFFAFALGTGIGVYNQFFRKTDVKLAYPGTPVKAGRQLNFQGFLTDSASPPQPILTQVSMQFKLYDAASAGNLLYDSGSCLITPDNDGIVNVLVGNGSGSGNCGSEISDDVFILGFPYKNTGGGNFPIWKRGIR
jgi:hypothetical protein